RTKHAGMDVVVVRENEEDVYGGIEYRQTQDMTEGLKLISRPGSDKIVRYAFDYARRNGRKKVTCFTKDNIMKITDGLFHKIFDEIAVGYPDIQNEHCIVDIGAAKLADTPEAFDVVVLPNLYGDILSDVAAQIAGSVGLAGSANIGESCAMFEAIHGSAPRRAGQNLANPSGLLLGGVMMLVHIHQQDVAERVHNAWLRTLEDGVHTYDIFDERVSKQKVGTKEFARAVVERLGQKPQTLKAVTYKKGAAKTSTSHTDSVQPDPKRQLVGVVVWVAWPSRSPEALAERAKLGNGDGLTLTMVDNRGVKVWPDGMAETFCTDSFRCRYTSAGGPITQLQMLGVLQRVAGAGLDIVQTVSLQNFEGKSGFTLAQGQ